MLGEQTLQILKDIQLSIGRGEFVSIMGPSGSGKSTLASILGCLARPTTGSYSLDGQDVTQLSSNQVATLRNKYIGFIFQDFNLLEGMTTAENVALPLLYAGVRAKDRIKKALECLHAVGLGHKSNHKPNQISGGQKQRVAIARALVNDPMFLFADEPTGALDKKTGQEILAIMQKLNMKGHTIVQVTHSPMDAQYSKRIVHLVDGHIIKDILVDKPIIGYFGDFETQRKEIYSHLWKTFEFKTGKLNCDSSLLKKFFALFTLSFKAN